LAVAASSSWRPVRFLSAVAGSTNGKLLIALDCVDGEAKFRALAPSFKLAEGAPALEDGRLSPTLDPLDRIKSAGIGV
jgi:hypothetical protein